MSHAAERRLAVLGRWSILSITDAAALLPGRRSDNIAWLRTHGLVRRRPGTDREEVRWGDVYDCYEAESTAPPPPAPATLPTRASRR